MFERRDKWITCNPLILFRFPCVRHGSRQRQTAKKLRSRLMEFNRNAYTSQRGEGHITPINPQAAFFMVHPAKAISVRSISADAPFQGYTCRSCIMRLSPHLSSRHSLANQLSAQLKLPPAVHAPLLVQRRYPVMAKASSQFTRLSDGSTRAIVCTAIRFGDVFWLIANIGCLCHRESSLISIAEGEISPSAVTPRMWFFSQCLPDFFGFASRCSPPSR